MQSNKISYDNILLLGSTSQSRKMLLQEAKIPFTCVPQDADEAVCSVLPSLHDIVSAIALQKMNHVSMPMGKQGERAFVLTADTLSCDTAGIIHGKPTDREDALAKIRAARTGISLCTTAFCLDRRLWLDGTWHIEERHAEYVESRYAFIVPEHWLETYLEYSYGFRASGAIAIEHFGEQFLRVMHGSYTTVIGLPMVELREALEKLGFFAIKNN